MIDPKDFLYWLDGYISHYGDGKDLPHEDVDVIKNRIWDLIDKHEEENGVTLLRYPLCKHGSGVIHNTHLIPQGT